MKTCRAFLIASILLLGLRGEAQTQNSLSESRAIEAASQLALGTKEGKALQLMAARGFKEPIKMGCSHGWTCFYALADGSSLGLDIAPVRAHADGQWKNGLLRAAYIQRNGENVQIVLKPGSLSSDGSAFNQDWQILGVVVLATCGLFVPATVMMQRKARPA
ncbi:MAG TPA: hypothetical protein VFE51_29755 [Verrucomicrobiae bacterium]|nr:hypothetical protein [Verrucomicrobiae bacterium]